MPDSLETIPILLVDDEEDMRQSVGQWLTLAGYEVETHSSAAPALQAIAGGHPGILVTDLRLPGMDGMDLLRRVLALDADVPVVVMTGHGDVTTAVEAMRLGAYDFIEKPFAPDRLTDIVRRACEKRRLVLDNRMLRRSVAEDALEARIVGTSPQARRLRAAVAEIAASDASVVLRGETGVGKDLIARSIHDFGRRARNQFVAINCAAIPETMVESELFGHEAGAFTSAVARRVGKLEFAHRGTLFLDEIESMPLAVQAKLLRALQERTIERLGSNRQIEADTRTIAASKVDLRLAGDEGRFRSDLYYRLCVVELHIPPLRERPDDIVLLFEHFVALSCERHGREKRPIRAATLAALRAHTWPGNVRELRNAAERYALGFGEALEPQLGQSSAEQAGGLSLADQLEQAERQIIERCLAETGGNIAAVMDRLGVPRRTLNEKMARLGIDRSTFAGPERQSSTRQA
ncbi:C4-dicarboxylate transport transcriptional regulatory protein DctD [Hartmannibacter diazotrophicus]|uniref:C4-dicarboxylate transport transcriptional regulatory protein DctD n=1 Tax=Hartmannibacter diazotrophicus TaxID=1482074 RepID=A0A2C9D610_9HYPH|nr:sigma-54 dependent transcriptional regulator [Hartmannibacter diazotrophicus]SON55630.1 C4-dicarboxylate transport transcriptional regulatory protein DctD [Hartmannibacter diazotrophicus]